ncbi:MAG: nucleotide exchange factor GrpE [Victivallaceae bacterium]|nr:nucleotide exchange factor GrpE [Victivallaceae bacterium]
MDNRVTDAPNLVPNAAPMATHSETLNLQTEPPRSSSEGAKEPEDSGKSCENAGSEELATSPHPETPSFENSTQAQPHPESVPLDVHNIGGSVAEPEAELESPPDTVPIEALVREIGAELLDSMKTLHRSFESKLKYDARKDEMIDRQHKEIEDFKRGLVERVTLQIVNDLIFEIDSTDKLLKHYDGAENSEENYRKMLKIFSGFSLSLRDILEKYGFTSYCSSPGSAFNPKRQRATKMTPTDDARLDKTVKASLRSGFETDEKIIRSEMVEVYIYHAINQQEAKTQDNQ